jgi:hypothetical protein
MMMLRASAVASSGRKKSRPVEPPAWTGRWPALRRMESRRVMFEHPPLNCGPVAWLKPGLPSIRQPEISESWQPTKSIAWPPQPRTVQPMIRRWRMPEHLIPSKFPFGPMSSISRFSKVRWWALGWLGPPSSRLMPLPDCPTKWRPRSVMWAHCDRCHAWVPPLKRGRFSGSAASMTMGASAVPRTWPRNQPGR